MTNQWIVSVVKIVFCFQYMLRIIWVSFVEKFKYL